MTIKDILENFDIIRRRPVESAVAGFLLVALAVFTYFLPKYMHPFYGLDGLYRGEAENNPFNFCVVTYAGEVKAQMSWPNSPNPDIDYVDYSGQVSEDRVDFTWRRNPDHPHYDSGRAVMTPKEKGRYGGYWESEVIDNNRQSWSLEKVGEECELRNWSG